MYGMKPCMYNQSDLPKILQDGLFDFLKEKENLNGTGFIIDKDDTKVPCVFFTANNGNEHNIESRKYAISDIRKYYKDSRTEDRFNDINFSYKAQSMCVFCNNLEKFVKDTPEQMLDKIQSLIGEKYIPKEITENRCYVNFDDASIVKLVGKEFPKGTVLTVEGYCFANENKMTEKHTFSILAEKIGKKDGFGDNNFFKIHTPMAFDIYYKADGELEHYWLNDGDQMEQFFSLTDKPLYTEIAYERKKDAEDIYKEMLTDEEREEYETHGTMF